MDNLISVIIPIYNSEQFLHRCLDSLVCQTYKKIEIILVNDGSTDNSEKICKEYAEKYSNVKLFNKKNGGLGSARNYGLEKCNGNYIGFVDSDDWVDLDYYEILLKKMIIYDADISSACLDITYKENPYYYFTKTSNCCLIEKNYIIQHFMRVSLADSNWFSVCTSLFKRKTIKNIRFREGKLNEDMDFKLNALEMSSKWLIINNKKYHYFQCGCSLSSGIVKKSDLDIIEASKILYYHCLQTKNKWIVRYGKIGMVKPYFSILTRITLYGCSSEIDKNLLCKKCIKTLKHNLFSLLFSPLKISRKFVIVCYCLNYTIASNCMKYFINVKNKLWN